SSQSIHCGARWFPATSSMMILSGHGAATLIVVCTSIAARMTNRVRRRGRSSSRSSGGTVGEFCLRTWEVTQSERLPCPLGGGAVGNVLPPNPERRGATVERWSREEIQCEIACGITKLRPLVGGRRVRSGLARILCDSTHPQVDLMRVRHCNHRGPP